MSVHGEYVGRSAPASEAMPAIAITHGYSQDHRPDLKQFMVDLRTAHGGETNSPPVSSGNTDAALYSQENLHSLQNLIWLCRVPATLTDTQQLKQQLPPEAFVEGEGALEGYPLVLSV